jgi:hypothetical protein
MDRNEKSRLDLLRVTIDSLPRFSPTGVTPTRLIEMLVYFLINANESIQESSAAALNRISNIKESFTSGYSWQLPQGESLAAAIYRISTQIVTSVLLTRYSDIWTSSNGSPSKTLTKYASIYLNALGMWLADIRNSNSTTKAEVTLREFEFIIQSIETRGLLFLIQQDPSMREIADRIFTLAKEFQEVLNFRREKTDEVTSKDPENVTYNRLASFHGGRSSAVYQRNSNSSQSKSKFEGTRIRDIFKDCEFQLVSMHFIDPQKPQLPETARTKDRYKLHALLAKERPLLHVGKSLDAGEAEIWNRCIPYLLEETFLHGSRGIFSSSMGEVRIMIRELHPLIISISEGNSIGGGSVSSSSLKGLTTSERYHSSLKKQVVPISIRDSLIKQWRMLLLFACKCSEPDESVTLDFNLNTSNDNIGTGSFGGYSVKLPRSSNKRSSNSYRDRTVATFQTTADVLRNILPLLGSRDDKIRQAIMWAVGSISKTHYHILLVLF